MSNNKVEKTSTRSRVATVGAATVRNSCACVRTVICRSCCHDHISPKAEINTGVAASAGPSEDDFVIVATRLLLFINSWEEHYRNCRISTETTRLYSNTICQHRIFCSEISMRSNPYICNPGPTKCADLSYIAPSIYLA